MIQGHLPIKNRHEVTLVKLEDILFIEQLQRRISVITKTGTHQMGVKIEYTQPYLTKEFVFCNRSLIVNLGQVISMRDRKIYFINGRELDIAYQSFLNAKRKYMDLHFPNGIPNHRPKSKENGPNR